MFNAKNSVNDAIKIMRDRAETQKASSDAWSNYEKRVRRQNIATAVGYVAGVALGVTATIVAIKSASKPMQFEDES
jgi:hypothetical protein